MLSALLARDQTAREFLGYLQTLFSFKGRDCSKLEGLQDKNKERKKRAQEKAELDEGAR